MRVHIISALPATTKREPAKTAKIRRHRISGIGMNHFQLDTDIPKPIGKKTGLIDIPMLNEKEFRHTTTLSTYRFLVKSKKEHAA